MSTKCLVWFIEFLIMINQSLCASATKQHIKISSFLLKFLLMLTKNAVIPSPINQLVSRGLHRAIHLPKISIWSLWLNSCGSLDTFCEDYLMILFRGFLCFPPVTTLSAGSRKFCTTEIWLHDLIIIRFLNVDHFTELIITCVTFLLNTSE